MKIIASWFWAASATEDSVAMLQMATVHANDYSPGCSPGDPPPCTLPPRLEFHLAPSGAAVCDYGSAVHRKDCFQHAYDLIPKGADLTRIRGLQQGSGGRCRLGWGGVPGGCSAQSGGAWTAHYKSGKPTSSSCVIDNYQLVCTNVATNDCSIVAQVNYRVCFTHHLAPPGAAACDYGSNVAKADCSNVAKILAQKMGTWPTRSLQQCSTRKEARNGFMDGNLVGCSGGCLDGGWGAVPGGCSAQTGGDWAAHYKGGTPTKPGCVHQVYQLVCTNH